MQQSVITWPTAPLKFVTTDIIVIDIPEVAFSVEGETSGNSIPENLAVGYNDLVRGISNSLFT